jgi:hypothetical protein
LVGVGVEGKYFRAYDIHGKEQWRIPGVQECYPSPFENLFFTVASKHITLSTPTSPIWKHDFDGNAVLHAAFSRHQVIVSLMGGPLQSFDFFGKEQWKYEHPKKCHALEMAWCEDLNRWFAIVKNYETGAMVLVEVDSNGNGRIVRSLSPHSRAKVFPNGRYVVSSEGLVLSTKKAEDVWKFL